MRDPADCALPAWRAFVSVFGHKTAVIPGQYPRFLPHDHAVTVHAAGARLRHMQPKATSPPDRSVTHRRLASSRHGWCWCAPKPGTDRRAWPALRWQTREEPPFGTRIAAV